MEITLKELHCGSCHTFVTLKLDGDESINVFLQNLISSNPNAAKGLQTSMQTIASTEFFQNERKFKRVGSGIFEIKVPGIRLYCFKDHIEGVEAKLIIATNGGKKNNAKEQHFDIKRAEHMRDRYLAAKELADTKLNYETLT